MTEARRFARMDLADLVDLQQTRPDVEIVEGLTKRITWPEIECVAGARRARRRGRHRTRAVVAVAVGDRRARRGRGQRLGVVRRLRARGRCRRCRPTGARSRCSPPRPTRTSAEQRSARCGPTTSASPGCRPRCSWPGGVGVPAVGLWGQVPHYLAGSPSPPATRRGPRPAARAERDRDRPGPTRPRRGALRREGRGRARRPPGRRGARAGDRDRAPSIPSGDELMTEIEQFLRSQPDQD